MTDTLTTERICASGHDDKLHARLWQPIAAPVRGCIIVVHGLGEHGARYKPVADAVAGDGWAMFAADLRGHGLSPGRRGHVSSYRRLLEDIQAMRESVADLLPAAPQVLLGHSMGGNLASNYVLRSAEFAGAIAPPIGLVLSAPMFLPAQPPNRTQIMAAWLTGYFVPWLTIRAPVDTSRLTRNEAVVRSLRSDPLVHRRLSLYLGTQLLAQGRYALDEAARIDLSTLVIHGEADPVTSHRASESFAIRAGDNVEFVVFPEMLHELFHETDASIVYDTLRRWLRNRIENHLRLKE